MPLMEGDAEPDVSESESPSDIVILPPPSIDAAALANTSDLWSHYRKCRLNKLPKEKLENDIQLYSGKELLTFPVFSVLFVLFQTSRQRSTHFKCNNNLYISCVRYIK